MKKVLLLSLLTSSMMWAADFSSVDSLGIVINGGNTTSKTFEVKSTNLLKINDLNQLKIGGHYTYGSGVTDPVNKPNVQTLTARNWDLTTRYERILNPQFDLFVGQGIEGDQFANIEHRFNTDLGARYKFLNLESTKAFMEAGMRYTVESYRDNSSTQHFWKGRLYSEILHKFNDSVSAKLWVEYLPNFTQSEDWNFRFEPSMSASLNKTFSVQLAFLGLYDNLPVGALRGRKFDYKYTTNLVAKF